MFKNSIKVMSMILLAGLVMFSSCKKDDDEPTTPPIIVLDGIYVTGAATAYTGYDAKATMAVARNEVTQTDRASLYELYIPLKAGTAGFNIANVAGAVTTIYGPGANWAAVAAPTTDEPKDATIMRGSVEETATMFNVTADGMYHVVIDMELMIATLCQVHWGIIGAATPDGWGTSTVLTESAFGAETMTWTISDMELRGGDWKFRYSNGWKIELDTNLVIGADKGVKINTNFGGAVDALVPGGANFVNDAPGIYTVEIVYVLGTGYTASATKTGDLPLTNWTGVVCDAVGTGISADNPNAIVPDPSGWGWGNKLLADGTGIPVVNGDLYTWTWTGVILEANEGFKVRTENGEAPPSGGANFDAGYGDLDVDASSTHVVDAGGNLTVDLKAAYTITLVIDAADQDGKTITITED